MAHQSERDPRPRGDTRTTFVRSLWKPQLPNNLHALSLGEGKYLLAQATSEQSATFEPTRDLLSTLTPLMPGELALLPLEPGSAVNLQIDRRSDSTIMISRNDEESYTVRGSAPMSIPLNATDIFVSGGNPDDTIINATHALPVSAGENNVLAIRRILTAEDERKEKQSYVLVENISQHNAIHIAGYTEQNLDAQEMRYVLKQGTIAGVEYATAAHIGERRKTQQDRTRVAAIHFPDGHEALFAIVADGNYDDGDKVAQMCIEKLPGAIQSRLATMEVAQAIADAVATLHAEIFQQVNQGQLHGGSTISCAFVDKTFQKAALFHVGDARTYIMQAEKLQQVGRDHSMVQELINQGLNISESDRRSHQMRSVIELNIGMSKDLESQLKSAVPGALNKFIQVGSFTSGMSILLCSDGLWEMVYDKPEQIPDENAQNTEDILKTSETPILAADRLIKAARAAGGVDNVSAVVLKV